MKKIFYIYGINTLAMFMRSLLNPEKAILGGYVLKTPPTEINDTFRLYPLISLQDLKSKHYDYMLICDRNYQASLTNKDIVLEQALSVCSMEMSSGLYLTREKLFNEIKDTSCRGIITGMSYTQRGILSDQLRHKILMASAPGQDLFYDFLTLTEVYQRMGEKLQFAISGLSPYSFRYDLSLSKENQNLSIAYFYYLKKWHHCSLSSEQIKQMLYYDEILKTYLFPNYLNILCDLVIPFPHRQNFDVFDIAACTPEKKREAIEGVKKLGNKPYPATLKENKAIFEEYCKFCKERNIVLVVLIPAFSSFFRSIFPREMIQEMLSIIYEAQEKFGFYLINLYDDADFNDHKHFADIDHLNIYGAELMTHKLDKFLDNILGLTGGGVA